MSTDQPSKIQSKVTNNGDQVTQHSARHPSCQFSGLTKSRKQSHQRASVCVDKAVSTVCCVDWTRSMMLVSQPRRCHDKSVRRVEADIKGGVVERRCSTNQSVSDSSAPGGPDNCWAACQHPGFGAKTVEKPCGRDELP